MNTNIKKLVEEAGFYTAVHSEDYSENIKTEKLVKLVADKCLEIVSKSCGSFETYFAIYDYFEDEDELE